MLISVKKPSKGTLIVLGLAFFLGIFHANISKASPTSVENPAFTFSKGSVANSLKLTFSSDVNVDRYEVKIYDLSPQSNSVLAKTVLDYDSGSDITSTYCDTNLSGYIDNFCKSIYFNHKFQATITAIPVAGISSPGESSRSNKIGIYWNYSALYNNSLDDDTSGLYFYNPNSNAYSADSLKVTLFRSAEIQPGSGDNRGLCSDRTAAQFESSAYRVVNINGSGARQYVELPAGYCYIWTTQYIAKATPDSDGVTWFDSEVSAISNAAPYVYRQITSPNDLRVIPGDKKLTVTWSPPTGTSLAVDHYGVSMSFNGADWFVPIGWNVGSSGSSLVISNYVDPNGVQRALQNGTPYFIRIAAFATFPDAKRSPYVQATGSYTPAIAPDSPGFSVQPGDSQLTLSISAPTGNGGSPVTGYIAEYSADGITWRSGFNTDSQTVTSVINGLTNGVPYYLRVAAINAMGTGDFLTHASTYKPYGTPTISLSIASVGSDTATVTVIGNAKGNFVTPTIRVGEFGGTPQVTNYSESSGTFSHTLNLINLVPGAHYNATARLTYYRTSNGSKSDDSTIDAMAVHFTTTPTVPENLSASSDADSITASWDTLENPINADISYEVQAYRNGSVVGTGCPEVTTSVSLRSTCKITGLTQDTSYEVNVKATIYSDGAVGNGTSLPAVLTKATKKAQSISFSLSGLNKRYGDSSFSISATSTSNLPITFTNNTSNICVLSGSTITIINVGLCSITASQSGDSGFADAASVTQSFTIGSQIQTISFTAPTTAVFGDARITLIATVNSNNSVIFTTSSVLVCSISGNVLTFIGAGICVVNANVLGDSTHEVAAQVTKSITVSKKSQTITFPDLPTGKKYSDVAFSIPSPASSTSNLPIIYSTTTSSICTVSGAVVTIKEIGTCTIDADQGGNDNYSPAITVSKSLTVGKATQSISFPAISDRKVDSGSFSPTLSATSALTVNLVSSTTSVCTVSSLTVTLVSVGTCTLVGKQSGDNYFLAATDASRSFEVNGKIDSALSNFANENKVFTDGSFEIVAPTSSVEGSFVYYTSNDFILSIVGSTATIGYIGTVTITAVFTPANSGVYNGASISKTVTIAAGNQATLSVTSTKIGNGYLLGSSGGSGFGWVTYELASDTPSGCTLTDWGYLTRTGVGSCKVKASKATDGKHLAISSASTEITFTKLAQSITFSLASLGSQNYGSWPTFISASSSSWLPVSLASTSTSICSVTNGLLTVLKAGICAVTASQSGDDNFAAANDVSSSFTINKIPLTVSPMDVYLNIGQTFDTSTVTISYSGFISYPTAESQTDLGGSLTCTSTYTSSSIAGDYPITCSGLTSDNYEITFQSATLHALSPISGESDPTLTLWPQTMVFSRIDTTRRNLTDVSFDASAYVTTSSGNRAFLKRVHQMFAPYMQKQGFSQWLQKERAPSPLEFLKAVDM